MARKKNATFQGVSWSDAKPNAATYARAVEDIAGDQALIFDKLTGLNTETETITHSGVAGRGAPIRHVLVSQHFGGRSLNLTNPSGLVTDNGGFGTFNVISVPIYIPQGIDNIDVTIRGSFILNDVFNSNARVLLTNTGLTETDSQPMVPYLTDDGVTMYTARLDVGGSGLALLFVQMDISDDAQNGVVGRIDSWTVSTGGTPQTGQSGAPYNDGTAYFVRAPGTTGTSLGVNVRDFDTTMFDDERPINAWLTQGMNLNINSLLEYVTGWPAHGNTAYVHRDDDSGGSPDAVNPDRSRFFAHTRASYNLEPLPRWPIICVALGSHKENGSFAVDPGTVPPTTGMLDFYAPFPVATTSVVLSTVPMIFPDFPTSSGKLAGAVLCGSNGRANVSQWTVTATATDAAGPPSNSFGTLAACDGSNDLWLATSTSMSSLWTSALPDVISRMRISTTRASAKPSADEVCILGFCFWLTE